MVTRLIESAQSQSIDPAIVPLGEVDLEPRREITKTVKIVMKQARSLPVAAALAMIAAAFIIGVVLGDRRETSPVAPVVVPSPAFAGVASADMPEPETAVALTAGVASPDTGFDLRVKPTGAEVVLDGRAIGRAPLRVRNLTPGDHVVELAADGYFARRLSVNLELDRPRELSVDLDRLAPGPEVTAPVAAAEVAAPEVAKSRPEPAQPARFATDNEPREKGTLKIGAKPPCEIVINGRKVGMTPRFIKLAPGRHRVSLVNDTYAIRERIGVKIKPGETVRVIRDYSDVLESATTK